MTDTICEPKRGDKIRFEKGQPESENGKGTTNPADVVGIVKDGYYVGRQLV